MKSSMNMIVVGVNHRTAPVEIREKFAIPNEKISQSLNSLVGDGLIREAVILSTCNRVEIYAICTRLDEAVAALRSFFKERSRSDISEKELYVLSLPSSIQHLYEVCAGLDSMVVGETEILGQVKTSYRLAHEAHRTGLGLNKLFQSAFAVAKEIRSTTRIGMGSVSVGSVAVDLTSQMFGDLNNRTVMLMGAGEMSEATARALKSRGAGSLIVTNRSFDRADNLAKSLGGRAVAWDSWCDACHQVDIVISSTASPDCVITCKNLEPVMRQRNGAPLFLIDIAVPRDIEREVSRLNGVYLYDIDDLQVIADQNLAMRQKEIAVCKQIVRDHADKFESWFGDHEIQIAKCPTARKFAGWHKNRESLSSSSEKPSYAS
jgi:glutamyl-tRNA reductase